MAFFPQPQTHQPHQQSWGAPPRSPVPATLAFQKPATVTLTLEAERFDYSGQIVDDSGRVVYKMVDVGDTVKKSKKGDSQPLEIRRPHDDSLVFSIDWGKAKNAESAIVSGLYGLSMPMQIINGLVNTDLQWSLPDGSKFEWDGVFNHPLKLFDYRIPQPYSLTPAVVAIWTPQNYGGQKHTTIEVHRQALSVPGFLDYLLVSVIGLEYVLLHQAHGEAKANNTKMILESLGSIVSS